MSKQLKAVAVGLVMKRGRAVILRSRIHKRKSEPLLRIRLPTLSSDAQPPSQLPQQDHQHSNEPKVSTETEAKSCWPPRSSRNNSSHTPATYRPETEASGFAQRTLAAHGLGNRMMRTETYPVGL